MMLVPRSCSKASKEEEEAKAIDQSANALNLSTWQTGIPIPRGWVGQGSGLSCVLVASPAPLTSTFVFSLDGLETALITPALASARRRTGRRVIACLPVLDERNANVASAAERERAR
ncbi:hypothetical protein AAHC03_024275 [Spirometra sp. Aus1]